MSFFSRLLAWLGRCFSEQPAQPSPAPLPGWPARPDQLPADKLLRMHNEVRVRAGLAPLIGTYILHATALRRAAAMAVTGILPGNHVVPGEGSLHDSMVFSGYRYTAVGENIAAGQPTPADVLAAWLVSAGHRNNILNPVYEYVGMACRQSPKGQMFWCVIFSAGAPISVTSRRAETVTYQISCPGAIDDRQLHACD